jgi:uncharacterized protein YaiI (UPF0178 family)
MLNIYVDADACPVKEEIYRVALRYQLKVFLVANAWMRTPSNVGVEFVKVENSCDAADHWIVQKIEEDDVVITGDIPLASRCLKKKAQVLSSTGRFFTEENIGELLASRELMSQLRDQGLITGGPAPFQKKDRSLFLQKLNEAIQFVLRKQEKQQRVTFKKERSS